MSRGRTAHLKSFPAVWYLFYAFLAGVLFAHGLRQTGRCQRSPLRDSRRSKKGAQRRPSRGSHSRGECLRRPSERAFLGARALRVVQAGARVIRPGDCLRSIRAAPDPLRIKHKRKPKPWLPSFRKDANLGTLPSSARGENGRKRKSTGLPSWSGSAERLLVRPSVCLFRLASLQRFRRRLKVRPYIFRSPLICTSANDGAGPLILSLL